MYHVPECSCVFYPSSASVKSNTGRIESTTTSRQLRLLSLCDPFISYFQTNGSPGINDIENGAASCENAPLWTVMIGMASTRYQDWNHRLVACSDKVSVFKSEGNRLTVQIHASQDGITLRSRAPIGKRNSLTPINFGMKLPRNEMDCSWLCGHQRRNQLAETNPK